MNSPRNIERSISNLLLTENKILNYDYNKLMKDFRVKDKLKIKSQEKIKKYKDFNSRWQETMERMHENKNKHYEEKRQKIAKKMEEKSNSKPLNRKDLARFHHSTNETFSKSLKSKEHSQEASYRMDRHFKVKCMLNKKIEMERQSLNAKISERLTTFHENNKDHLRNIREKFSQRISKSLENAKNNIAFKENNNYSKLEELKVRPLKKYENWYVSYYTSVKKDNQVKKEHENEKKERIHENIEYLDNERELNNQKSIERFKKIERRNLMQQENLRAKLMKSNNEFKERLNRIYEKKTSSYSQINSSYDKLIGKHYTAAVSANALENLYFLKQSSIHEKNILNQIINQKKINVYARKLPKLHESNISLKNSNFQKKAYMDLKRKEEEEKRRLEDELKEKEKKS